MKKITWHEAFIPQAQVQRKMSGSCVETWWNSLSVEVQLSELQDFRDSLISHVEIVNFTILQILK